MGFLIDANVLSESSRIHPDPSVLSWLAANDSALRISSLTMGELVKGIHLLENTKRRKRIEQWFQRIDVWSAGRILPLDTPTMRRWGVFYAKHQKAGRKLNLMDSLLAATALQHQLTLVTRNIKDFPDDVTVFNPWGLS